MQVTQTCPSTHSPVAVRDPATGLRFLLAAVLLLTGGYTRAHTVCVATAVQLQDALATAANVSDLQGTYINVVKGTYKTTDLVSPQRFIYQTAVSDPSFYIVVRGGWNPGCTVRTAAATDTVLDGDHTTQVLVIRIPRGSVEVYGLTIQNGETDQSGAGLAINDLNNHKAYVQVSTNIIRNNHTTFFDGGFRAFGGGSGNKIFFRNNVVYGNSADMGSAAGTVIDNNGAGAVVNNNTVTRNTTTASGAVGGLTCLGTCTIANNIFRDNSNIGIYIGQSGAVFDYNDYGTLGGVAPATSTGNLQVSAGFVNAVAEDFHLAGNSPLIAASPEIYPLSYPYTDPDGHESPSSGLMDIGAYQETIFSADFD